LNYFWRKIGLKRTTLTFNLIKLLWSKTKVKQINCREFLEFDRSKDEWCFLISMEITNTAKYDIMFDKQPKISLG
jgi:hypothetical protein